MTKNENRQRVKNEALNKIWKLYNGSFELDRYDHRSLSDQRDEAVSFIVRDLNRQLKEIG